MKRSTPPSSKAFGLFLIHFFCFVKRGRPERLDPQAQRPDRPGDENALSPAASRASRAAAILISRKLAFEPIRLQLVPGRSECVRLDDVGTGLHIFLMHFAHKVRADSG